jgi:23S rRNA (pseudouridine1915-N3)-methyltransferase
MKFTLFNTGKTDTGYIQTGTGEYARRINHFIDFSIVDIAVKKAGRSESPRQINEREGESVIKAIQPYTLKVLLDEKGKEYTSREFAGWLEKTMNQGSKQVAFITGGAYGFSDELYKTADLKISLSKMTFTHQMARLFFVEQLYRALTLIKGIPYHND